MISFLHHFHDSMVIATLLACWRCKCVNWGRGRVLATHKKIKTMKIYAGGSMGESTKICTRENIPLYSRLFIYKHYILCKALHMVYFLIAHESCGDGNGVNVFNLSRAQVKLFTDEILK